MAGHKEGRINLSELIKINPDGKTTARELYDFLQLRPGDYSRWCKNNIVENEFAEEGTDYFPFRMNAECGGQASINYELTIPFAKKLCMMSKSERGNQARNYFIEVETRYQKQITLPTDPLDLIIMQATAMKEIKSQVAKIEHRVLEIESQSITRQTDYYTIAGYASLRGIKVDLSKAGILGKKATKLSTELGYDIGKTHDPRFGRVNTYHIEVLGEVLECSR